MTTRTANDLRDVLYALARIADNNPPGALLQSYIDEASVSVRRAIAAARQEGR